MPLHSVIIPHRGRPRHLELCLWALERSALVCGVTDWETVVRDDPVDDLAEFNKSRALNLGIRESSGDILTFLDVDAIVGKRFMEAALCLEDASLDRCCYRVRKLRLGEDVRIETAEDRDAYVDELFSEFDRYPRAMEAYGHYHLDARRPPAPQGTKKRERWDYLMAHGQSWGNSQFSIRRERLGDLRYDEEIGWHTEDIDMNMQLQARFGKGYRGRIFTDPEHAMFHLEHVEHPWDNTQLGTNRMVIHKRKRRQLLGW